MRKNVYLKSLVLLLFSMLCLMASGREHPFKASYERYKKVKFVEEDGSLSTIQVVEDIYNNPIDSLSLIIEDLNIKDLSLNARVEVILRAADLLIHKVKEPHVAQELYECAIELAKKSSSEDAKYFLIGAMDYKWRAMHHHRSLLGVQLKDIKEALSELFLYEPEYDDLELAIYYDFCNRDTFEALQFYKKNINALMHQDDLSAEKDFDSFLEDCFNPGLINWMFDCRILAFLYESLMLSVSSSLESLEASPALDRVYNNLTRDLGQNSERRKLFDDFVVFMNALRQGKLTEREVVDWMGVHGLDLCTLFDSNMFRVVGELIPCRYNDLSIALFRISESLFDQEGLGLYSDTEIIEDLSVTTDKVYSAYSAADFGCAAA